MTLNVTLKKMEIYMKKLIIIFLALNISAVFACPDISGTYSCTSNTTSSSTKTFKLEKVEDGIRLITGQVLHWGSVDSIGNESSVNYNGKTIRSSYYGEPVDYTYQCDETGFSEKRDDGYETITTKIIQLENKNIEIHTLGENFEAIDEICEKIKK